MISKIVSGGQTGADQAALDAAIEMEFPYGGWLPKGRKTENGPLSLKYNLQEMDTGDYRKRTEQNVMDSDGTLILSHGPLKGGSLLTKFCADKHNRPCLHIDCNVVNPDDRLEHAIRWMEDNDINVLNVAGPRLSGDHRIYDAVKVLIAAILNVSS